MMAAISNIMQRVLDSSWFRHEILAGNVANSETPGYKAKRLNFEDYLKQEIKPRMVMATTNPLHVQASNQHTMAISQDRSSVTPDGNSVDIDKEMAEVSANALYYTAISRQLASQFSLLRKAITEGRR